MPRLLLLEGRVLSKLGCAGLASWTDKQQQGEPQQRDPIRHETPEETLPRGVRRAPQEHVRPHHTAEEVRDPNEWKDIPRKLKNDTQFYE